MSGDIARTRALRASLMVALAASSWGCWSLFLRPSHLSAGETSPILFLVMGLALLPFGRLEGITPRCDRQTALLLIGNAACDGINVLAFFAALSVTTVGIAVLTHYLAPLFVALLAPLIDRERVRGSAACAIAATIGLALVLEPWTEPARGVRMGALLGTLSAVAYAGNVFIVRRLAGRIGAARTVSWHSLIAAAFLAPFADRHAIAAAGSARIGLLVAGAVVLGALAGWLFARGLVVIGSTRAAMLAYMEPLVAMLVGWLAWSEPLSATAILGGGLILAAGAWISRAPRRVVLPTS